MASTPARDLPLLDGELTDLLTGLVCKGTDAGPVGRGAGLSAVPQRSQ
ncbi:MULTISPECIES: hypothetical protein [Nonomuraea]|uniref:Uncharacterized protein n=1 Tax=Nonomuraea salmonea TaxID=46181 RepID=A0ABV5NZ04_9ACTN